MNHTDEEAGYDRQLFYSFDLVGRYRHEVLIDIPGKKRRRRLTITNTLAAFQRLVSTLAS